MKEIVTSSERDTPNIHGPFRVLCAQKLRLCRSNRTVDTVRITPII